MQEEMQDNVEVVHTYRQHIMNDMNPGNLHLFINAYNRYRRPRAAAARPFRPGSLRGPGPWGEAEGGRSISRRGSPQI